MSTNLDAVWTVIRAAEALAALPGLYDRLRDRASARKRVVYAGLPAPTKLAVPPHKYLSDTRILIGADEESA